MPYTRATIRRTAVILGVTAAVLMPTAASATPPSGITSKTISKVAGGGKEFTVREITIAPGGSTGWHWHDGTLYVTVMKGTLTFTRSDCVTSTEYPRSSTFTEPVGSDTVHIGRNLTDRPVVLQVLYVNPKGAPLTRDAANPGCSFE